MREEHPPNLVTDFQILAEDLEFEGEDDEQDANGEEQEGYDLDTTVTAFRDYFEFLTKMYLDESAIIWPPEGGWPHITEEAAAALGKSPEVIELLRMLPYIKQDDEVEGSAQMRWEDWSSNIHGTLSVQAAADLLEVAEGDPEAVPSHVIGIAVDGVDYDDRIYLDTVEGNMYWIGCPGSVTEDPDLVRPETWSWQDEEDYPEKEGWWRNGAKIWSIPDFFEVLKDQFRTLRFLPQNNGEVGNRGCMAPGHGEEIESTFREHGWPDLERYRKRECMEALEKI